MKCFLCVFLVIALCFSCISVSASDATIDDVYEELQLNNQWFVYLLHYLGFESPTADSLLSKLAQPIYEVISFLSVEQRQYSSAMRNSLWDLCYTLGYDDWLDDGSSIHDLLVDGLSNDASFFEQFIYMKTSLGTISENLFPVSGTGGLYPLFDSFERENELTEDVEDAGIRESYDSMLDQVSGKTGSSGLTGILSFFRGGFSSDADVSDLDDVLTVDNIFSFFSDDVDEDLSVFGSSSSNAPLRSRRSYDYFPDYVGQNQQSLRSLLGGD